MDGAAECMPWSEKHRRLPDKHENVFIMIPVIPPPWADGNLDCADLCFGISGEQTFKCNSSPRVCPSTPPHAKAVQSPDVCQISLRSEPQWQQPPRPDMNRESVTLCQCELRLQACPSCRGLRFAVLGLREPDTTPGSTGRLCIMNEAAL